MPYTTSGDGTVAGGTIAAGRSDDGTVTITGGAYSVTVFEAGVPEAAAAPTAGTITLAGGGTAVVVEDPGSADFGATVSVGHDNPGGTALLRIEGGASLLSRNSFVPDTGADVVGTSGVFVGRGDVGFAEAQVYGAGSALLTEGLSPRINVGYGAGGGTDTAVGFRAAPLAMLQGSLVLGQGGYARTLQMEIGREDGRGLVVVKDPGSELRLDASGGGFAAGYLAGEGGFLNVGRSGGRGYLAVRDGGRVIVDTEDGVTDYAGVRLARDANSYGYLVVEGAGSRLELIQRGPAGDNFPNYGAFGARLLVGRSGEGVAIARDGARIDVLGDEAFLSVGGNDREGGDFTSRLEILSGASVLVDSANPDPTQEGVESDFLGARVLIGNNPGSSGAVTVSGDGSRLVVRGGDIDTGSYGTYQQSNYGTGFISVGRLGEGTMTVTDGGYARARSVELGVLNVYGDDGPTGEGGVGTLTVSEGGEIKILSYSATPYQSLQIGPNSYGTGTVTVTGSGSRITLIGAETEVEGAGRGAARVQVGERGTGTLAIEDGGHVAGFFFEFGRREGGSATVTVDGVAEDGTRSTLKGSDEFGTFLAFEDGEPTGEETNDSTFMRIGREAGATGTVNVTSGGLLFLENDPEGDKVFPFLRLGQEQGARGSLIVDGIARDAEGNPILDDAGTEIRSELRLVQNPVSEGAASRGGVGIDVGGATGAAETNGTGTLTVANGGLVTLLGNDAGISVGEADPGQPGEGEESRQSRLVVESGGEIVIDTGPGSTASAFLNIGQRAGGDGAVTVTGAGSLLSLTGRRAEALRDEGASAVLTVGREGTGSLDVRKGGRVLIDGTDGRFPGLQIGRSSEDPATAGTGTVTVSGAGSEIVIAGTNESVISGSGFLTVGRFDGDRATLEISEGGRVALTGARDTSTSIAGVDGSTGLVRVLGEGSLFEAGRYLVIGGDIDETVPAGPDNALTEAALVLSDGDGTLFLRGGTATAEAVFVGPGSLIDASGALAGDTTVSGALAVAEGEFGALALDGDLRLEDGATLRIDARSAAEADRLTVTGDADFNLAGIAATVRSVGIGALGEDTIVLAEVDGALLSTGAQRVGTESALLDLVAEDGMLFLRQGASVSTAQAQTVALLFEAGLDRDGDIDLAGLNFWIDAREGILPEQDASLSEPELAQEFLFSPEFAASFGDPDELDDEALVGVLYDNVLDRESEPVGFDFWVAALGSGAVDRAELLLAFAKSEENRLGSPQVETLEELAPGEWGFG